VINFMLGLEISDSMVRAVAAVNRKGSWQCLARSAMAKTAGADFDVGAVLRQCVQETLPVLPRADQKLVVTLPAGTVLVHMLRVPVTLHDNDVHAYLRAPGVLDCLPDSPALYSIDFARLRPPKGCEHCDLLVFAARNSEIAHQFQFFEGQPWAPSVVDSEAFALQRFFAWQYSEAEYPDVYLHCRPRSVSIHVFQSLSLVFSRQFAVAGSSLMLADIKRALQMLSVTVNLPAETSIAVSGLYARQEALADLLESSGLRAVFLSDPDLSVAAGAAMRGSFTGCERFYAD
jgi:Tfp pilus assembly PilM family ATPase